MYLKESHSQESKELKYLDEQLDRQAAAVSVPLLPIDPRDDLRGLYCRYSMTLVIVADKGHSA